MQDTELTEDLVATTAREFEDAATEVLLKKTQKAIDMHGIQTLIIGGGVSANLYIREQFTKFFTKNYPELKVYFPPQKLSTDNSIMIALAGHARIKDAKNTEMLDQIVAEGNLAL